MPVVISDVHIQYTLEQEVHSKETVDPKKNCTEKMSCYICTLKKSTAYIYSVDMQCILWSFTLSACVGSMFNNHNTTALSSFHHSSYQPVVTVLTPISAAASTLLTSFLSDFFIDKCPRIMYVLVFNIALVAMYFGLFFFTYKVGVVIAATVVIGCGLGFVWNLTVVIISEVLGVNNFDRNWGTVAFSLSAFNCVTQYMFGGFYDVYADSNRRCIGMKCYRWTFGIRTVMCIIATTLLFVLAYR